MIEKRQFSTMNKSSSSHNAKFPYEKVSKKVEERKICSKGKFSPLGICKDLDSKARLVKTKFKVTARFYVNANIVSMIYSWRGKGGLFG